MLRRLQEAGAPLRRRPQARCLVQRKPGSLLPRSAATAKQAAERGLRTDGRPRPHWTQKPAPAGIRLPAHPAVSQNKVHAHASFEDIALKKKRPGSFAGPLRFTAILLRP